MHGMSARHPMSGASAQGLRKGLLGLGRYLALFAVFMASLGVHLLHPLAHPRSACHPRASHHGCGCCGACGCDCRTLLWATFDETPERAYRNAACSDSRHTHECIVCAFLAAFHMAAAEVTPTPCWSDSAWNPATRPRVSTPRSQTASAIRPRSPPSPAVS